jgi:Dolichyl-phosphate-mannose-protein mannosyltransferase
VWSRASRPRWRNARAFGILRDVNADDAKLRPPPRDRVVLALAGGLFVLHMSCAGRYGVFRDELYYVACGEHLAFGYVDHPPLVAVMARASRAIFGESLVGLRVLPALLAAAMVLLVAELARTLGGGRFGQALAATCAVVAPVLLGTDHFLSMNCVLPAAWTAMALFAARALVGGDSRAWLWFGLTAGVALLAKHSTLFWGAALAVGIALGPHRRALLGRGPWLAIGIAALLLAPNVAWEQIHGWPTLEFMHNAQTKKMVAFGPLALLQSVVLDMHPLTLPLWAGGLAWLLVAKRAREHRFLGVAFVALFAIILAGRGKPYYMAPGIGVVFAAGGVMAEQLAKRAALRVAIVAVLAAGGASVAPMALPILDPPAFVRYAAALGVSASSDEKHRMGPLPQHFADQFGWEAMARKVKDAYDALPPEERAVAAIYGGNYGEAGAVDYFGRAWGLPRAVSGHNAYFMWGPPADGRGGVLIAVGEDREDLLETYEEVVEVGRTAEPNAMPYENDVPIYVCRRPRRTLQDVWPSTKHYI